ncbi:Gar1/Naf1 family protein [Picrophilus oshimae]|uniref:RNA-binding protein n=1 Tax=Picrophilus torridus (strain ATCC 700027 / DSM 9790 / JCM 10055 / NBRC 100828 / KAW 2/3) TaxID=1122961 RepID=Q6KZC8_PICTO|nr:Gar1/Naf1 family protein [Picrophilus oshimae]AAT43924.1 hypothetical protein PTO1339 [Picrophilus oshimae DSM 9789]SMD31003.1 RNA-binding protein [Picrophilus oshimae DSM 9789]
MRYQCRVVHIKNNEMLIRIDNCIKMHENVYSDDGKNVGKIIKILGPVRNPYALVRLREKIDIKDVYVRC